MVLLQLIQHGNLLNSIAEKKAVCQDLLARGVDISKKNSKYEGYVSFSSNEVLKSMVRNSLVAGTKIVTFNITGVIYSCKIKKSLIHKKISVTPKMTYLTYN